MAEPQVTTLHQPKPLPLYQALIKGMVTHVRSQVSINGKFYLTLLRLPAADSYSHPATIEVISDNPIGKKGDEVEGVVGIGGRPYNRQVTDPVTGEIESVPTAFASIQWIED